MKTEGQRLINSTEGKYCKALPALVTWVTIIVQSRARKQRAIKSERPAIEERYGIRISCLIASSTIVPSSTWGG